MSLYLLETLFTAYVYAVLSRGSMNQSVEALRTHFTDVHTSHCLPSSVAQLYITTALSGVGYLQAMVACTHNPLDNEARSERRVESRAEEACDQNERNAIVASIESITMTTMSSTRVKPETFCLVWGII